MLLNNSNGLDIILTFIMLGSTLGFLVHNFNPAKIFMGDSGSMFLGYIIAVIALLGFKNVTLTSFIIPILLCLLFLYLILYLRFFEDLLIISHLENLIKIIYIINC